MLTPAGYEEGKRSDRRVTRERRRAVALGELLPEDLVYRGWRPPVSPWGACREEYRSFLSARRSRLVSSAGATESVLQILRHLRRQRVRRAAQRSSNPIRIERPVAENHARAFLPPRKPAT